MAIGVTQLPLGNRLKRFISYKKSTVRDFATAAGIPYRTLQDYVAAKRRPGADHLERLAAQGIDLNWLLTGTSRTADGVGAYFEATATEVFGADETLMQGIVEAATRRADEFNRRHVDRTGRPLPVTSLLRVVSSYVSLMLEIAKRLPFSLEDFGGDEVGRALIVDTLSSPLDASMDQSIASRARIELPPIVIAVEPETPS